MEDKTVKEAFDFIKLACSKLVGNLADHQAVQQALSVLEKKLLEKESPPSDTKGC